MEFQVEDTYVPNQPELSFTEREEQEIIREMIDSLSDEQRMCIMMYYMEDLSVREIAETSHKEFRVDVPFSREGWHGRMRACRGVGASMSPEQVAAWDKEHKEMLEKNTPENFMVKHYISIAELQVNK